MDTNSTLHRLLIVPRNSSTSRFFLQVCRDRENWRVSSHKNQTNICTFKYIVKVKQPHYRPAGAQSVPGSSGSQIS